MLPKKYRLTDRQMFRKTLSKGNRINGNFFLLTSLYNVGTEEPRVGVIISKKISKKAVVRNKIKRVVYDSMQKFLINIARGSVLVFLAKKLVSQATGKEINEEVDIIMKRYLQQ